jgi:hypothetical protein
MFSGFPKIIDRNFIISYLLPVILALLTLLYLLSDLAPFEAAFYASLDAKKADALTVLALSAALVAVLLMVFNTTLYRLLEGYWGPFSQETRREKYKAKLETMQHALTEQELAVQKEDAEEATVALYYKAARQLLEHFPPKPLHVLPTRFGNAIRAFETYPLTVYGIDSIPSWIRLQPLISKQFMAAIEDSRAKVDFWVNVWVLALVVSGVAIGRVLWTLSHGSPILHMPYEFMAIGVAGILTVFAAYNAAISQIVNWGHFVKAAFDLYLPDLAKKLGHDLPETAAGRRAFWNAVNSQALYWDPVDPQKFPATKPELAAKVADDAGDEAEKSNDEDKDKKEV